MKPELRAQLQAALADRYTLDRDLGRGGMASVVMARDLQNDRMVALKVLHSELTSTVGGDRFKREIRVAARLQHPHILGILDSGETPEGQLWFTMPLVDGENIYERLERERQFPPAEAIRIATAAASALAYAHEQGVVHRDIKPDNIMLAGDQVLVADFGVARAVSEVAEKLTATGMIVGTPTYMSPEQASGDKSIDGRSDTFALGCVLYEMLAGEPPFRGPNPQATLMRRFMGPPRPLRPMVQVSEQVEAAIIRSLAKDPAERFATAAEFADALAGRAVAPPKPAAADHTRVAAADPAGAKKKGCAAVLLAGVGLAGAAAGLFRLLL
ncbi:MAG TPA: serine/threonine-protein kinase [Gemmatimonadales bacterium]|nr:serine/threonine-protein kinase [Gemmatimonadales bacterium]